MSDRIGVRMFAVNVTPVSGSAQRNLLARLDVMERELRHMETAITDMKRAVRQGSGSALASAVLNSRNWVLSLVMSHSYVQMLLGKNAAGSPRLPRGTITTQPSVQLHYLFEKAVNAGLRDGEGDRPP